MKYSKKQIIGIIVSILVIGAILCGVGFYQKKTEEDIKNAARRQYETVYDPEDTYTICLYVCGTDLESQVQLGTEILNQIQNTKLPKGITVLTQAGGAEEWGHDKMENGAVRRFRSKKGERLKLMEELFPVSMADGETLSDFLLWCNETAPADHQVLILWGHGRGSAGGILPDEQYPEDIMTLTELRGALEKAFPNASAENPPLELAALMTCLGQNIDTAAVFQGFSKYYTGSEEVFITIDWRLDRWLEDVTYFRGMDGKALGTSLCDALDKEHGNSNLVALSNLDLSAFPELFEAYDSMGKELLEKFREDPEIIKKLRTAAEASENYGYNDAKYDLYYNMVDLGDLCIRLKPELDSAQRVIAALEQCVAYCTTTEEYLNATGLAAYFPYKYQVEELTHYQEDACSPAFLEFYRLTEEYENP